MLVCETDIILLHSTYEYTCYCNTACSLVF